MLKLNLFQTIFLVLENRRECRKSGRVPFLSDAEREGRYNYYTDKLLILLGAVVRAKDSGIALMWARHASAIMDMREKYREGRPIV